MPPPPKRRGRPPKTTDGFSETRHKLIQMGIAIMTEKGFSASGLDEILSRTGVPKGSFYYYFESKDAFGLALIEAYAAYFNAKLHRWLADEDTPPIRRVRNFVNDAAHGMNKHHFQRGCLVGNLGQELGALPDSFRMALRAVLHGWEDRLTTCLMTLNPDQARLWAQFFWTGWEGAVLRARLEQSDTPLQVFADGFVAMISTR